MAKGVQEAVLDYDVLGTRTELSLVRIYLQTGRTHQIRCQFSARGLPLWGDKKYSTLPDDGPIALWSHCLHFAHPDTGEVLYFEQQPPGHFPLEPVCRLSTPRRGAGRFLRKCATVFRQSVLQSPAASGIILGISPVL